MPKFGSWSCFIKKSNWGPNLKSNSIICSYQKHHHLFQFFAYLAQIHMELMPLYKSSYMEKYVNCVTSILEIKKTEKEGKKSKLITLKQKSTSLRTKKDNLIWLTSLHILQQKSLSLKHSINKAKYECHSSFLNGNKAEYTTRRNQ